MFIPLPPLDLTSLVLSYLKSLVLRLPSDIIFSLKLVPALLSGGFDPQCSLHPTPATVPPAFCFCLPTHSSMRANVTFYFNLIIYRVIFLLSVITSSYNLNFLIVIHSIIKYSSQLIANDTWCLQKLTMIEK